MKKVVALVLALVLTCGGGVLLASLPMQAAEYYATSDEEFVRQSTGTGGRRTLFNDGWRFFKGKQTTAQNTAFDDSGWESVSLPHDYSIDGNFTVSGEAESGFLLGGEGWYRKTFVLPASYAGKSILLEFGGIYMCATVYVNGVNVAYHPYGYTSFAVDIGMNLICDGMTENVIAVYVNCPTTASSRWYSGAGIYRSVYLTVTDGVHIDYNGVYITTPDLETQYNGQVTTKAVTTVANDTSARVSATVRSAVYDEAGNAVSATVETSVTIAAGATADVTQNLAVSKPSLWSPDSPILYYIKTEIIQNGIVSDTVSTEFGYRFIDMTTTSGFYLNGSSLKLKGVCLHHDEGALGAAEYYDAIYRKLVIMKDMGVNAIRVTHNPASRELIEICNRLGLMVIEEAFDTWTYPKNGNYNDYSQHYNQTISSNNQIEGAESGMIWGEFDVKAMVDRDKNDPCLIMWSIGNEILEGLPSSPSTSEYSGIAQNLCDWIQEVDTVIDGGAHGARYLTIGDNKLKSYNTTAIAMADIITAEGGAVGLNYCNSSQYSSLHSSYPSWILYGAETTSSINSRGVYNITSGSSNYECTSYDYHCVGWGAYAHTAWADLATKNYIAGTFVWTGFDYIGEPTTWNGTGTGSVSGYGAMPNSSYFGTVDTAGFYKDTYYFYRSLWNTSSNTLHIVPGSWTLSDLAGSNVKVDVYSNAEKVELYLNDTLVSTLTSKTNYYFSTNVTWKSGTLRAVGYDGAGNRMNQTVGTSSVTTNTSLSRIELSADSTRITAGGQDLCYITLDLLDSNGNLFTGTDKTITLTLDGDGEIVGVDNGKQNTIDKFRTTIASDKTATITTYNGKALIILRGGDGNGTLTLNALCTGIVADSITVNVTASTTGAAPGEATIGYYICKQHYITKGSSKLSLPATVKIADGSGTTVDGAVTWNTEGYDKDTIGVYAVNGKIEGIADECTVYIHVVGEIAAVLNYSMCVAAGELPELPTVLGVVYADGTLADETASIVWDTLKAADFATAGVTVSVKGIASDCFGNKHAVDASVRVAAKTSSTSTNIAPDYHSLTESCSQPADNLLSITDGVYNIVTSTTARWTNWYDRNTNTSASVTMTWATSHIINSIKVYWYYDTGCSLPTAVTFESSSDGENFTALSYTDSDPINAVSGESGATLITYTLKRPTDAIAIRITGTEEIGKCFGITECEVIAGTYSVTANTSAYLSSALADGAEVADGYSDRYAFSVSADKLVLYGEANAAVTVLPADNAQVIRAIVISENGENMNTYSFVMSQPTKPEQVSMHISVSEAVEGESLSLSCTVLDENGDDITAKCSIVYVSSDTSVATVSANTVNTVAEGQTTITANVTYGGATLVSAGHVLTVSRGADLTELNRVAGLAKKILSIPQSKYKYTVNSLTVLKTTYANVLEIQGDKATTQNAADNACKLLSDAVAGLTERKLPTVTVQLTATADSKLYTVAQTRTPAEADQYCLIREHGIIYIRTENLNEPLTLQTTGRYLIRYTGYNTDGTYTNLARVADDSVSYTFRSYIKYVYYDGTIRTVYSNDIPDGSLSSLNKILN